uniref:Uncharacterized protein n=1 Tax=viral metagenome TaxID=1070528 RepID=A0A6C0D6J6_9ZZZZ
MALKFRKKNKKYYKIIITILICLLLGFLYLGNYNLRESLDTDISGNSEAAIYRENRANRAKQANMAISATGGNNGSDGYNAQIQAFTLVQNLEGNNSFPDG